MNCNGVLDFNDLIQFNTQMDWIMIEEPLAAFDYNDNGSINFGDIIWLFDNL